MSLTDRGRELFETVVPTHLANEARLLGSLTPAEQATLAGLLRKLLVAFEGSAEPEGTPVRLGLTLAPVHVALAMQRAVGLPEHPGLLVRSAEYSYRPARLAVAEGDILTKAGGEPLRSVSALYAAISGSASGGGARAAGPPGPEGTPRVSAPRRAALINGPAGRAPPAPGEYRV